MSFPLCGTCGTELAPGSGGCIHYPQVLKPLTREDRRRARVTGQDLDRLFEIPGVYAPARLPERPHR